MLDGLARLHGEMTGAPRAGALLERAQSHGAAGAADRLRARERRAARRAPALPRRTRGPPVAARPDRPQPARGDRAARARAAPAAAGRRAAGAAQRADPPRRLDRAGRGGPPRRRARPEAARHGPRAARAPARAGRPRRGPRRCRGPAWRARRGARPRARRRVRSARCSRGSRWRGRPRTTRAIRPRSPCPPTTWTTTSSSSRWNPRPQEVDPASPADLLVLEEAWWGGRPAASSAG